VTTSTAAPVLTEARVVGCERLSDYQVLSLRAPEIARATIPGQFVNLSSGALLRRPFSVFRAADDQIAVAFDVVGEGTQWLAARAIGDTLGVVGPLGTGFNLGAHGPVLAVGGGYGAAPLFLLAERLRARGTAVHAIIGAARAARVFAADHARAVFDSVTVTTEDGSLGERGRVTDVLDGVVAATGAVRIATCGPMPMLAAVAACARGLGLACEVAVEEFMACGVGVCWTCVVAVESNGDTRFIRSCTEGPVLDGSAVSWG
jgi:dihydroorotate dehydrogenase electron transfer subunit